MTFWQSKRVLVTGGAGFTGSFVVEELLRRGGASSRVAVADDLSAGSLANLREAGKKLRVMKLDLREPESCLKACRGQDVVIHMAGRVAGVAHNAAHPASMFNHNMLIDCHMFEAARQAGVRRFLQVSTACVYPRDATVPTPESEGFRDVPEASNAGYGWAKRMGEFLAGASRSEFGLDTAIVRTYNTYGPRDYFGAEDSHVIASLAYRALRGDDPLVVWGDGKATRSFLYVEDAARGIVEAAAKGGPDAVNIGTDEEISIGDLARLIVRLVGTSARLEFDPSKPSGQPRRNCDNSKARRELGFVPAVRLEEGLRRTIEWYRGRFR